jgi:hypothetical protein
LEGGRFGSCFPDVVLKSSPSSSLFPSQAPMVLPSACLAARACGDWSRALHAFALTPDFGDVADEEEERDLEADAGANDIAHEKHEVSVPAQKNAGEDPLPGRSAYLILEGPYGRPTPRAGDFERVLLFAGGSGATFTLGVLDEVVGRCVRLGQMEGEKTRQWCGVGVLGRLVGVLSFPLPPLLTSAPRCCVRANPSPSTGAIWHKLVRPLPPPNRHLHHAALLRPRPPHTHLRRLPLRPLRRAAHSGDRHRGAPHIRAMLDRLLNPVAAPGVDCCGARMSIRGARAPRGRWKNLDDVIYLRKGFSFTYDWMYVLYELASCYFMKFPLVQSKSQHSIQSG